MRWSPAYRNQGKINFSISHNMKSKFILQIKKNNWPQISNDTSHICVYTQNVNVLYIEQRIKCAINFAIYF